MEIDHIFIFSKNKGKEADEFLEFGFTEGSNRAHIGQGTVNRKFYFENFFIEILWVENENEIKSKLLLPTKLWERSNFENNEYSPFGLCIVNTEETEMLFEKNIKYQPEYFPKGLEIEILNDEKNPKLPWTFRLPFKGEKKKTEEPILHKNGINILTKTEFKIPIIEDKFTMLFKKERDIKFENNNEINLTLTFDKNRNGKEMKFEKLPLTIKY
jgi:Glyoxalase-like domain